MQVAGKRCGAQEEELSKMGPEESQRQPGEGVREGEEGEVW